MPDIFQQDEMLMRKVNSNWSSEDLLAQDGVFFLKDLVKPLNLDSMKIKRLHHELVAECNDPWETLGAKKVWSHWIVRMKVFAPYYREHLYSWVSRVDSTWDGNTLLVQDGHFYLSHVCRFIPFTSSQVRYQCKKVSTEVAREEYGVWKDDQLGKYVVHMPTFSKWITQLWK